jgi:hypothetical protein
MPTDQHQDAAFFYGTLMSPAVLRRVLFGPQASDPNSTTRRPLAARDALLPGFQRRRVRGADYPAIVPRAGAETRGVLVRGLTPGDVWRLDVFEGDEYARREVEVQVLPPVARVNTASHARRDDGTETVRALTYVWMANEAVLEESEWDFDEFKREKMWRWVGKDGELEGEYYGAFCFRAGTFFADNWHRFCSFLNV